MERSEGSNDFQERFMASGVKIIEVEAKYTVGASQI